MDHGQDYCEHFHKEICQESKRITTNNLALTKYFTQLKSYLHNISQSNSQTHSSFLNVYQSCLNYNMEFDFQKRMQFGKHILFFIYLESFYSLREVNEIYRENLQFKIRCVTDFLIYVFNLLYYYEFKMIML